MLRQFCCPICKRVWNYEASFLRHVLEKHFHRPRGKFIAELPIKNRVRRCFHYSFTCWCGWDAFGEMVPPFIRSDFSMAKIAATLHLERSGGVDNHWLHWRLDNIGLALPPWLKNSKKNVTLTSEGTFMLNDS